MGPVTPPMPAPSLEQAPAAPVANWGEASLVESHGEGLLGEEEAPKFTTPVGQERRTPWKRLAWAAVWLVVAAGGVYTIPRLSLPSAAASPAGVLEVQMSEIAGAAKGQLAVRWDLKSAPGSVLRSGEVTIVDGAGESGAGTRQTFTLSPRELRAGALTYWRKSKHVEATVTLQATRAGVAETVVGQANFGQVKAGSEQEIAVQKALREQLKVQRARGRDLEQQLLVKQPKP
jgi:hypothetical protein